MREAPGAQTPSPEHALQLPHEPQPQLDAQVRVRVCMPQLPQASVWLSVWPGVHTPPPPPLQVLHVPQLPHEQSPWQVRVRVWVPPQLPHDWLPMSVVPAAHTPSPMQT